MNRTERFVVASLPVHLGVFRKENLGAYSLDVACDRLFRSSWVCQVRPRGRGDAAARDDGMRGNRAIAREPPAPRAEPAARPIAPRASAGTPRPASRGSGLAAPYLGSTRPGRPPVRPGIGGAAALTLS